jgi:murein DD-endopeptidase MepM/ murein hydrolase activator NlpD
MAAVHEYKRFENSLVKKLKDSASALVISAGKSFQAFGRAITRRYTIVFVPHSEKKVYNLHITIFSVICFLLIVSGIVGGFLWYGTTYNTVRSRTPDKDTRLRDTQASLDSMRDGVDQLHREMRNFESALTSTITLLGADIKGINNTGTTSTGDLSTFLGIDEIPEGSLKEVEYLRRITEYLAAARGPVEEIGLLLDSQSALLTEIPSIWPVRGGIGHISGFFGQTINPFTGQYYIHKGIDISTYRQGDPIVATADGQVVTVEFDQGGFGNNVVIRHMHGFYTRYAHMLNFAVKVGQRVQQGEVIGYIGNTGLSTGPHLHYEIRIGSDVVDPYKYITIRSSLARTSSR